MVLQPNLRFDVEMVGNLTPPDIINQKRPERINGGGPRPINGAPLPPGTPEANVPGPDPGMRDVFRMIRESRYEQAEKQIDKILKENPDSSQALVAKGEIYWNRGELEKAQGYYKTAAEKDPKSTLPLHRLVNNSLLMDDPDSALQYFEKTKEIEAPGDIQKVMYMDALLMRGADRKIKKDEKWREDAKLAEVTSQTVENKESGLLNASLGQLYVLTGERKKAIERFEKSLTSDEIEKDYKIDILMSLAVLYTETGDRKSALKKLDELIDLMDKWKPTIYQRGLFVREYALLYKKNILGAEINPDDVFKHERFYRELYVKKIHRPEVEVKQTLSILSEMPDMSFDEDLPTLIDEVNEYMSISEGPKYPQCFFNKMVNRPTRYMIGFKLYGDIYYHYLKKDKAIFYYKKALELSPDNPVLLECIKKAEKL
ncbi:MAG: tetratricopeptide repeat protein [Firmicutes bacterium]|nr:tetratricopeptide repeat protein [Bacillota bacterium]